MSVDPESIPQSEASRNARRPGSAPSAGDARAGSSSSDEARRLREELFALELRLAKSEAEVQDLLARVSGWESMSRYGRQRVVFLGLLLFAGVFITYLVVRKLLT